MPIPCPQTDAVIKSRFLIITLLLTGIFVSNAHAARHRHRWRNTPVPTYQQAFNRIESVDRSRNTVTIAAVTKTVEVNTGWKKQRHSGKTRKPAKVQKLTTLKVNQFTQIEMNGQRRDINALSKGMNVSVTKGADDSTASRLVIIP